MKKIGVFGDSFAVNNIYAPDFNDEFNNIDNIDFWEKHVTSWIDLIGAQTYGIGGTDIQYSFLEFGKHHSKYDQVIFVLTNPHRVTLKDENDNKKLLRMVAGWDWKTDHEKNYKSPKDDNIEEQYTLKALSESEKILIVNTSYQDRIYLFYNLVIERIKQIRPDIKFIPGCCSGFPKLTSIPLNISSLKDIMQYENKIMKWKNVYDEHDTRIAHLTKESHIILALLIKRWLKTDEMFFDFDIKEFHNIKPNIKEYYTNE